MINKFNSTHQNTAQRYEIKDYMKKFHQSLSLQLSQLLGINKQSEMYQQFAHLRIPLPDLIFGKTLDEGGFGEVKSVTMMLTSLYGNNIMMCCILFILFVSCFVYLFFQ
jgi:hypothetical protein